MLTKKRAMYIINKGNYVYPACKTYRERGSTGNINVCCDLCNRQNLQACINYKDNDLCLTCVQLTLDGSTSTSTSLSEIYKKPLTKMMQDSTRPTSYMATNMMQDSTRPKKDITTYMMQDSTNPGMRPFELLPRTRMLSGITNPNNKCGICKQVLNGNSVQVDISPMTLYPDTLQRAVYVQTTVCSKCLNDNGGVQGIQALMR